MNNDTPSIHFALLPAGLSSLIGLIVGCILSIGSAQNAKWIIASGLTLGFLFGAFVWFPNAVKTLMPARFHMMQSVTPTPTQPDEPPVILIEIPERGITYRLSRCGIILDDWMSIAEIAKGGGYNQSLFEQVLGREEERGRSKYREVSPLLADDELGVLKASGTGYKVTDHEGKEFFTALAKGDWRVLDRLPKDMQ